MAGRSYSDNDFRTLFAQVKGLDMSYRELCRTLVSLLDKAPGY